MYNLIRFEVYKLIHSKLFRNAFITILGLIILNMYLFFNNKYEIRIFNDSFNGRDIGFVVNRFSDKLHPNITEFFHSAIGFMPVVQILVIALAASFVIGEYNNGTIKNILSYGHSRIYVYVSKVIAISISILVLIFLWVFGTILLSMAIRGCAQTFSANSILEIIEVSILIWIVLTSIASICICLSIIFKSTAIIVSIGITELFLAFIYIRAMVNIFNGYPKYIPTYMLLDICNPGLGLIGRPEIVVNCLILILVTLLVGCFIFKNQDVK